VFNLKEYTRYFEDWTLGPNKGFEPKEGFFTQLLGSWHVTCFIDDQMSSAKENNFGGEIRGTSDHARYSGGKEQALSSPFA
jgi:hypothetical protein